jgi:polyisoprenoid-binding protein YceI
MENGLPQSGECSLDMNSINIDNINNTEKEKILNILRSEKYLDVQKFPLANYSIRTFLTLRTASMPDKNLTIKGSLTLKETTILHAFPGYARYYDDKITLEAGFRISSSQFQIPLTTMFNDNPLSDEIEFIMFIVAK